jgi:hypothetical protein
MEIKVIPKDERYKEVLELYPPQLANKFLPEWYKQQKISTHYETFKHFNGVPESKMINAKNCPAIQDYLTTGFIIPAWTNIRFHTSKDENGKLFQAWDSSIRMAYDEDINLHIDSHPLEQTEFMDLKRTIDNKTLKLQLPYVFKVPKGYNIIYQDPFYHFRNDIKCLTGIVEADKWGSIAFPFEVLKDNFELKAGTPLIQCFLYKREDLNLSLNIDTKPTQDEYDQVQLALKKLHISNKTYRTNKEQDETFLK